MHSPKCSSIPFTFLVLCRLCELLLLPQIKTRPPTFALVTNIPDIDDSYIRFLKKNLQEEFNLYGMDVRINIRATAEKNPYAPKRKVAVADSSSKKGERKGPVKGERSRRQEGEKKRRARQ